MCVCVCCVCFELLFLGLLQMQITRLSQSNCTARSDEIKCCSDSEASFHIEWCTVWLSYSLTRPQYCRRRRCCCCCCSVTVRPRSFTHLCSSSFLGHNGERQRERGGHTQTRGWPLGHAACRLCWSSTNLVLSLSPCVCLGMLFQCRRSRIDRPSPLLTCEPINQCCVCVCVIISLGPLLRLLACCAYCAHERTSKTQ